MHGKIHEVERENVGVEANYTALETALREKLARIESAYPSYDEYRYSVDEIGHDPFELASYLTAKYESRRIPHEPDKGAGDFQPMREDPALRGKIRRYYFLYGKLDSPGPVSHVGIYVSYGMMIHCGNPISYTSIETSYWQSYFYSYGR